MKVKILLGFVAGVALTSGVFYVASRKHAAIPVRAPAEVMQTAPAASAVPAAPVEAAVTVPEQTKPAAEPEQAKATPERPKSKVSETKPSAVIAKRPAPKRPVVEMAKIQPPPQPVSDPEPQSEPVQHPAEVTAAPAPSPAVVEPAPEPVETPAPAPPEPPPAAPEPHSVTLAAGTLLTVRLGQTISSEQNVSGDSFIGTLDQPLVIDGFIIAERGSRVQGRVVDADRAGRVKGVARISLELTRFHTSDGQDVHIQTQAFEKQGSKSTGEDAAKVGAGAAIGAIIGAIAGGGRGAGIGAWVGGAAGAGTVMATRGKPAMIPVETRLSFRVMEPVTITEQLQ